MNVSADQPLQAFTPFDLSGPLDPGITVLEASAGTGKTYSIAHLVVRLVAELDIPIETILVVTFTRAATAELRDRLRRRVGEAISALREEPVDDGLLVGWAAKAPPSERPLWLSRLEAAREGFDAATISTIHGFCQRVLQLNAFESGAEFDLELVPDLDELLEEVTLDFLARELYGTGDDAVDAWRHRALTESCGFDYAKLLTIARAATDDPEVPLVPDQRLPTLADWRDEVDALIALLESPTGDPRALTEKLRADKALDGKTYQAKKTEENWAEITRWLQGRPGPGWSDRGAFRYWDPDQLVEKAKKDIGDLLQHPFVEAWGRLARLASAVVTGERLRFAKYARAELFGRLRRRYQQSYADLLRELARALRHDKRGPLLRSAIRERYRVALIDEFQDTDALQWEIFQRVFDRQEDDEDERHLYLIGDPKQAIYAFRGANVHVYLRARHAARQVYTMGRNFRSDAPLVDGLNHLMHRPALFGPGGEGGGIEYLPVDTPRRDPASRLRFRIPADKGQDAPVQLRFFDHRLRHPKSPAGDKLPTKTDAARLLPRCISAEVVRFFDQEPEIWDEEQPTGPGWRDCHPGDVAVLTRSHRQAAAVRDALREAGLPAVVADAGNVFDSVAAADLQRWLEALSRPSADRAARAAAATDLVGWRAKDLQDPDEERWSDWLSRLATWRATLHNHGFMRAFRQMLDSPMPDPEHPAGIGPRERLLRLPDGERRLTDLLHLAELLHEAETVERLGLSGLLAWLKERRHDPPEDGDATTVRLETDAAAVRIITIHKSKGLEFPVVLVPYLWDGQLIRDHEYDALLVGDEQDPVERRLDLRAGKGKDDPAVLAARKERLAENMRLLYVALTRARHRLVVWWGALNERMGDSHESPCAALLHGDPEPDEELGEFDRFATAARRVKETNADGLFADLGALVENAPEESLLHLSLESWSPLRRYRPPAETEAPLSPRPFRRSGVDHLWRLHSYSSLTRGAAALAAVEGDPDAPPDRPGLDPDATDHSADPIAIEEEEEDVPLARFPAGAEAGTCLHEVFEKLDFEAARPESGDAASAVREVLEELLPLHGFPARQHVDERLVRGFLLALRTPLGSEAGPLRLCDIPRRNRFDELRFDVPLAGGRDWMPGAPTIEAEGLARALTAAPSPGISEGYLEHLRSLPFGRLRLAGFMTGSIDLVFRHPGDGRWYVVDYKSNRIDPMGTRRYPPRSFRPPLLQQEMEHHHYHLQYLLYTLALHRYLRHRMGEGYDYERCIGGIYYLFFRGMLGEPLQPDGTAPRGVFHDRPPVEVVDALDILFDDPGAL